jgi:tetratricopeptide (TPR) repeat protein
MTDIQRALEINRDNIFALNSMAELYAVKGEPEKACCWLDKAISKGYNNWAYLRSSKTYDKIRDSECFRDILRRVDKKGPIKRGPLR